MTIQSVQRKCEEQLMRLPNVIGVSVEETANSTVIKVLVTHRVSRSDLQPHEVIPPTVEGFETEVQEIGFVTAQDH